MLFPEDFLIKIANEYNLTKAEREVFLPIFSEGKSKSQIAKDDHISQSVISTRLTGVYSKFGFPDMRPHKAWELGN